MMPLCFSESSLLGGYVCATRDKEERREGSRSVDFNMNQKPPPADKRLVGQIAQGGPIGQCLHKALDDLVAESFAQQADEEDTDKNASFDNKMAQRVMTSFGRAVAESRDDWNDCPAALLRGRVDYYNKMEQKWRIVVEDGEIRPRVSLENGRSRKKQKVSLWDAASVAQGDTQGDQPQSVKLSGALQILAFNDS